MVNITRRKVVGSIGVLIGLGACLGATDPDDDIEASSDDTSDGNSDDNGDNGGNGGENGGNGVDGNGGESEPEVNEPDAQAFSGSGATVEDNVSIEGGLTVIDASHSGGSSNFQVQLVGDGEYNDLFVNEIGEYDGATAQLIEAGTYQLDVEADGDWEIEVRQPREASGDGMPQSLSGDGPDVLGPFEFGGSHTASGSHSGDSNFAVHVYPTEGQFGELVFNEIGSYDGETTFNYDGIGYVAIEANGGWSLELE